MGEDGEAKGEDNDGGDDEGADKKDGDAAAAAPKSSLT